MAPSLPVAFLVRFLLSLCSFAPLASLPFFFLPLLPFRPVLHVLISFAAFPSRSFDFRRFPSLATLQTS